MAHFSLKGNFQFLIDCVVDDARRAAQFPTPIVFAPPPCVFSNKHKAREVDVLVGLVLSSNAIARRTRRVDSSKNYSGLRPSSSNRVAAGSMVTARCTTSSICIGGWRNPHVRRMISLRSKACVRAPRV